MNEELVCVLRQSISQTPTQFHPAAEKLRELETTLGYYHNLLEVALQFDTIEPDVRLAALLQLKNGVDKKWRSYCHNPIAEEEKSAIRVKILVCLNETVPRVARQFAYIVSRVARHDYPQDWPDVIPSLLNRITQFQCNNPTYADSLTFLTFRMVATELASRQLMTQRSKLQETCQMCLPVLMQCWDNIHTSVVNMVTSGGLSSQDPRAFLLLDIDINIEKSLRRIARRIDSDNLILLLQAVVTAQRSLCQIIPQLQQTSNEIIEKYQKILITLSKIVLEVLDCKNPQTLGNNIVGEILQFCKRCVIICADDRQTLPIRFLVNCMNQIKQIVQESSSKVSSQEVTDPLSEWDIGEVRDLIKCLIFKYFPLSGDELELWNDDIIDFCTEEIGENWKYNLRPCAEILFMTLLRQRSNQICPMIFETIDYLKNDRKDDVCLNTVIMECAIYKSLSLSASELFDSFDFEEYFENTLISRVQQVQNQPYGKIIHRSALKLLHAWLDVRPFTKAIKTTWEFIVASLNSQLDFAVRFEAANALKQFLYDFENDISYFMPHQEDTIRSLNHLLEESNEDLKMQILDVFNRIIERIDDRAVTFIEQLSSVLQNIWMSSEKHEMLRCSVLVTMINVIEASRDQSCHLHPIALPMIHSSCNVGSEEHVYLMLDGLELWTSVIHHATTLTPHLLQLFSLVFGVLDLGYEEAKLGYHIIECYLLLGGSQFAQHQHFTSLASTLNCVCMDMSDEILGYACQVLDHAIQIAPKESVMKFGRCLIKMHQLALSGEVQGSRRTSIILLGVWINILEGELAPDFLCQAFESADPAEVTFMFVNLISNNLDALVESEQKKAACMSIILAMDRLSDANGFRQCLPEAVCTCVQTLHDVCDEKGDDEVLITDGEDQLTVVVSDGNSHQTRCRHFLRNKPTFRYPLPGFIKQHFNQWGTKFFGSSEAFTNFLTTQVDHLILQELNTFLSADVQ